MGPALGCNVQWYAYWFTVINHTSSHRMKYIMYVFFVLFCLYIENATTSELNPLGYGARNQQQRCHVTSRDRDFGNSEVICPTGTQGCRLTILCNNFAPISLVPA